MSFVEAFLKQFKTFWRKEKCLLKFALAENDPTLKHLLLAILWSEISARRVSLHSCRQKE